MPERMHARGRLISMKSLERFLSFIDFEDGNLRLLAVKLFVLGTG
jgi:hypothetical protein